MLPLTIICIVSFYVRLSDLDRPIQYDEAYTYIKYVSRPFWHAIHTYNLPNNHVFHSLCAWLSVRVFGDGQQALRLPVFLAGIALVPMCYLLGKRASGSLSGLVAAALAGASYHLVDYSVNARGYGMQAALYVFSLWLAPKMVSQTGLGTVIWLSMALALAMFTVPTLVFGAGTVFIWALWLVLQQRAGQRKKALLRIVLAGLFSSVFTLALYAPVIHYLLTNRLRLKGDILYGDLPAYATRLARYLDSDLSGNLAWLVAVAILIGWLIDSIKRRGFSLALLWLIWPVLTVLLHERLSVKAPFERSFVFLLPLLYILAGHGVSCLLSVFPAKSTTPVGRAAALFTLALFAWPVYQTHARNLKARAVEYRNPEIGYRRITELLRVGDHIALSEMFLERLRFYARASGDFRFKTKGRRNWKLTVTQLLDRQSRSFHCFALGSRIFMMQIYGHEKARTLRWLRRHTGYHYFDFRPVWQSRDSDGRRMILWRVTRRMNLSR